MSVIKIRVPELIKNHSDCWDVTVHLKNCDCNSESNKGDCMKARFNVGDSVMINHTNQVGTISKVSESSHGFSYYVRIGEKRKRFREEDLSIYVDIEDAIFFDFENQTFGNADQFRQFVYFRRFSEAQEKNLYSHQGNKIIFNPFQYKPLLKFLSTESDERILIADEVGVGKTIETGIILDELFARGDLNSRDTILVVCPNVLCRKWQSELKEKFQMDDFQILDSKALQFSLTRIKEGSRGNILHGIVSEQLIRSERYQLLLEECRDTTGEPFIHFLVIDECHHYRNPETNTHKIGSLLSRCAERVVMLSATPFNLRSEDLFYQLNMLNPALFPEEEVFHELTEQIRKVNQCIFMLHDKESVADGTMLRYLDDLYPLANHNTFMVNELNALRHQIQAKGEIPINDMIKYENTLNMLNPLSTSFTRTLKRDAIEHRVTREVRTAEVHFTEAEAQIYQDFIDINMLRHKMRGVSEKAFGLISNGLERIAASSVVALEQNIKRFMQLSDIDQDVEEVMENDLGIDSASSNIFKGILTDKYNGLLKQIHALNGVDSKYNAFKYLIDSIQNTSPDNPRIIVFSFYVGTLKYLRKKLKEDGFKVSLMYGNTPAETPTRYTEDEDGFRVVGRNDLMRAFHEGEFDILLASEVGGEGLDFQFCTALINYDLPYNPMRIEQRIGRIDRMGQLSDKIIIGNLCIDETIDMVINRVLLSRISDATDLLGELEPIITHEMEEINKMILRKELTPEELRRREKELSARIEKERVTREEFDRRRFELVNDTGFRSEFEDAIKKSRIDPVDSCLFTIAFLKGINGCWSKQINETAIEIHLSKELKGKLAIYYSKIDVGAGTKEISSIIKASTDPVINFKGSDAYNHPDHIFVKPSGAWIHFMIDYLKGQINEEERRVFSVSIKENMATPLTIGAYLVYVYDYEFVGFRDTLATSYIVVNLREGSVVSITDDSLDDIFRNVQSNKHNIEITIEDIEDARYIADDASDNELEHIQKAMTESNDLKIVARMKAIQSLSNMNIKNKEEKLFDADDKEREKIVKAIEKEKKKTKEKLEILEKKRHLTSSSSLQGLCLLEVI